MGLILNRGPETALVSTSLESITPVTAPVPVEQTEPTTEFVIEPRSGWATLNLAELWRYRELAFYLAWRDVKVRYKQTILGAAWAVLQPLLTMMVFAIFFGRLGRMDEQTTIPYKLFVYTALVPWQFFSYCVTQCSQSLVSSANLISKVYFPRLLVPLATIGVGLVDAVVASLLLVAMMAYYHFAPTLMIGVLPLLCLGLLVASVGVGTLLSALTVTYRDFRYVVPFLAQLWMFASPVAYSLERIPAEWRVIYCLNPMAGIIGGFRACLLGEPMNWDCLRVSLGSSLLSLLVGAFYFRRVERRFADIV